MFGYSIKEVLEDNSMDIYMIMEALDLYKSTSHESMDMSGNW